MTAQTDRDSRRMVRLDEGLLEPWISGNAAYDTLDDSLRRVAIHLGLLRENLESSDGEAAWARVDVLEEALASIRVLVHRLEWLDQLRRRPHPADRVSLRALIERVLRRHSADLEAGGALVVMEDLPVAWASPDDLEVLFSELIANAVRFRGDAPLTIRFAAERARPDWVLLTVSDTASGFSDEYHESVFEPGVVLLQDGVRPGAGVGLAACRMLVERNRGEIRVESTPGDGSTFTITLPSGPPATAA